MRMKGLCFIFLMGAAALQAADLGQHGAVFEIREPDFLQTIHDRLAQKEARGEIEAFRRAQIESAKNYVHRPTPAARLTPAETYLRYEVDLSMTVNRDLSDHRGVVFARAGTVINPLETSTFTRKIILFDGDRPEQVEFALGQGNELDVLLVLTSGAPLELMRAHGRRFYFDQDGVLSSKFAVQHLPARISRAGLVMQVEEIPLKAEQGS